MKILVKYAMMLVGGALIATACTTTMSASRSGGPSDDLYATHDRAAIARAQAEQSARIAAARTAAEQRAADAVVARERYALEEIENAGLDGYYSEDIFSDTYEESYARRLQGFGSLTYNLPSSYWDYRYSDAYFQTMGYDPAFYSVIVMGDQVWVEPRYVTSMFGTWGRPVNYCYGWNSWSWYRPYWNWHAPYWGSPSWSSSMSWGYPYYGYGWGSHYGWGGGYNRGYWNGYRDGYYSGPAPYYGRYDRNVINGARRPMTGSTAVYPRSTVNDGHSTSASGGAVSGRRGGTTTSVTPGTSVNPSRRGAGSNLTPGRATLGSGNTSTRTENGVTFYRRSNSSTPSGGTGSGYNPSGSSSRGSSRGSGTYNPGNTPSRSTDNSGGSSYQRRGSSSSPSMPSNSGSSGTSSRSGGSYSPSSSSGSSGGGGGSSSGGGSRRR
ncbi:MAG: hypothetical protein LBU80_08120 [Rikenellaceae bacterium]|jgi:hypothetical protein|nr:hypothetical protein [Rikenellaceae bacterium]